jgi:hypothetical protein
VLIWLDEDDYLEFGESMNTEYLSLSRNFLGFDGVNRSQFGDGREGVYPISWFYHRYIGRRTPPSLHGDWSAIPEVNLSIVTNGEVFQDPLGEFTRFRKTLLSYYPEDLQLKKLAARCMKAAQSGQYNYSRCLRRKEYSAAFMAAAEFVQTAASIVFLLNRRYTPFYKWIRRALEQLPILGESASRRITEISTAEIAAATEPIEALSGDIILHLREIGLSESNSDFLLDHAPYVQSKIENETLRQLPLWYD